MASKLNPAPLASIEAGLRAAFPVCLAYLGIGFAAGAFCERAGMSTLEVALVSLMMFAGSAHFIFAELIVLGAPLTMVVTVFLVNFRHFLYASAFALRTRNLSLAKRAWIGAQLTDETFAVASSLAHEPLRVARGMVALNVVSYFSWAAGTVAGALAGGAGGESLNAVGIEFALGAMFASLLMLQVISAKRGLRMLAVAGIAAALMIVLELVYSHPLNLLVAACGAAGVGTWLYGMPEMNGAKSAPASK